MSTIELTAYSGAILGPIARVLGWIMNGIYDIMYRLFGIESVTLSIFIITIIIYLCLLPLTIKQQKFSKLSQKMQPEIKAVQDKYKGKKDQVSLNAMNQETQLIYQKYGVSPMGTCLPALIQFPILMALYQVFRNVPAYIHSIKECFGILANGEVVSGSLVDVISKTEGYQDKLMQLIEECKITVPNVKFASSTDPLVLNDYIVDILYKLPKSGWDKITDYFSNIGPAADEMMTHMNRFNYLLGMNISENPWYIMKTSFADHAWLMLILALMVPVLSYLTQVLNLKMMPTATGTDENDQMARQMKSMNTMMPLMSLFFCFTVPVGLGVYWIFSALVRVVQQFFINRHIQNLDLEDIIAQNQEKARKKREKMGITEDQFRQAAQMKTRSIGSKANLNKEDEARELELEKAEQVKANAKPGSLAAKANLVREFNERNSRK